MPDTDNNPPKRNFNVPTLIAIAIVVFSFTLMIIMVANAFSHVSKTADPFGSIKDILGLFLPMIGTWMGTILAFYFSRENFESASRSMQQTITKLNSEEKLKATKATTVMIPVNAIAHPFVGDVKADTITIKELLAFLDKEKRNRIVVMDDNKVVSQVIHRSIINSFISDQILNGTKDAAAVQAMKIADMAASGSAEVKGVLSNGIAFISQDATLLDAQKKISDNKSCQDVFITQTGSSTEPVIGWISNVIVSDNAKV